MEDKTFENPLRLPKHVAFSPLEEDLEPTHEELRDARIWRRIDRLMELATRYGLSPDEIIDRIRNYEVD